MRSLTHFLRLIPTWTLTIPSAIVNSLPPSLWFSLRGERENWKNNTFSAVEDSTRLRWHSGTQKRVGRAKERDQSTTKQDIPGKALWKQNIKASLASLSFDSSRAPTEWSAIFAFGVFKFEKWVQDANEMTDDVIHSTQYYLKDINRAILANLWRRSLKSGRQIVL